MAIRPIFLSSNLKDSLVETKEIDFEWHPGLSVTQKQKSIDSMHISAKEKFNKIKILEISSKSKITLGVNLSAFNLCLRTKDRQIGSVEVFFQGSKVFTNGGPYIDLYQKTSREAKKDQRLLESGDLLHFNFEQINWPLSPQTVFYDWLYCKALTQNERLAESLLDYNAFTDIEFNPRKSINCQAASAALFKSLNDKGMIIDAMKSNSNFIEIHKGHLTRKTLVQNSLF